MKLFFDIETTAIHETYLELSEDMRIAWSTRYCKDSNLPYDIQWKDKSPLYAEFAKVVCISYAGENSIVKTVEGDTEREILSNFMSFFKDHDITLIGHNIYGFDIPFICKRAIINGIKVPSSLHGIKKDGKPLEPWKAKHIDTAKMWKMFGRQNTSLVVICGVLGVESPKNDMDGSQVMTNYYAGNIEEIKKYCEADVIATREVYFKLKGLMSD